ncbi:bifunctional phosphoribosylaminoimidazolecarboxamide formyltransferase/IMP cyclohydrolase [Eubacteriales bacterium OttesenSCG-928-M02]|nr:bifunctional phosphoribosylaminoimidazolecarboxamide formyltransferase/IMP cyclohydrolase [Eubacteriales bacterium OttesenSCG-928-M02]
MAAKRAFLSVSDKTGIVELARELVALGYQVVSTGGTESIVREGGVAVTNVSDITGFPECLDGRVKTLHPVVHGGILYMRDNPDHVKQMAELEIGPIDIVAVNLYPFKETIQKPGVSFEEAIENIDIGGPTMLRSAAKNHRDVCVVVDAADYPLLIDALKKGTVPYEMKRDFAKKVFEHTAAYDALIAQYLREEIGAELPDSLTLTFDKVQEMRYGENPHQKALFYKEPLTPLGSLAMAEQLGGKELSFNNINDTNGALDLMREFREEKKAVAVAVKHANPCGVGVKDTLIEAYTAAYEADPKSIYGGIVALNRKVDVPTAEKLREIFLEIIIAPDYDTDALAILTKKKNLRVLKLPHMLDALSQNALDMKKVLGGLLVQEVDRALLEGELEVVTETKPTEAQLADILLAWKIVKHTKSNGIAVAKDGQSLGIGPGQVNRIWAVEQSIERSGDKVKGASLASDAYFPFDDSVRAAAAAGISCIIQPGGSIRDKDSIDAANELGLVMVYTGMRHFKH